MSNQRNHASQFSTTSSDPFRPLFQRLLANWSINQPEVIAEKSRLYRETYDRIGHQRFASAVNDVINSHSSGFFPTVGEFMQYVPEPQARADNWQHSPEEWAAIHAEQQTPEFQEAWDAWMRRLGVKPAPFPQDLGRVMQSDPNRERK